MKKYYQRLFIRGGNNTVNIYYPIILYIIFIILCIPTGKYLSMVISYQKNFFDKIFDPIDNLIFKITCVKKENMTWKEYCLSLLCTNFFIFLIAFSAFRFQNILFNAPSFNTALSFNSAVSFITNTNLQDYSGEDASLITTLIIISLMFVSAASGFAVAAAFIRGLMKESGLGNFFVDITRIITRVLIPLSIIVSVFLIFNNVPQTFKGTKIIQTIEGSYQAIKLGPVAALESIKHIGTNGGGIFSANSSHPYENPNMATNTIEMLSMMLLPGSLVLAYGFLLKNKKQGIILFITMSILFIISTIVLIWAEKSGNPILANIGLSQSMGNMEGKEVRFGIIGSSLFSSVTTSFTTGSVNNMHDSLTPIGGFITLWNMMLNVIFGGKGIGLISILIYAMLTVFISGLMVGRTPEFLGKKLEEKEIKIICFSMLIHPILVLIPTAVSLIFKSDAVTNPGFHGLSQILYQFTTSSANNGSGFEGLLDNTNYWNLLTGITMFLGRYTLIVLALWLVDSLRSKREVPETEFTFRTDNLTFAIILIFVILVIGALTFLPVLALGPVSEHLMIH